MLLRTPRPTKREADRPQLQLQIENDEDQVHDVDRAVVVDVCR